MRVDHIDRVIRDADLETLAALTDPALLWAGTPGQVLEGLAVALRHTLGVNAKTRGWFSVSHGLEFNRTGLRTRNGAEIGLLTRYFDAHWDRCEPVGFVTSEEQPAWFDDAPALPWAQPQVFDPSIPIELGSRHHLVEAHPERWLPLNPEQVRWRLGAGMKELRSLLKHDSDCVGSYWYQPDQGPGYWSFGAPLAPDRSHPVAAVLRPDPARGVYRLITVLPLHTAFWNVASTGQTPPAWMNPSPDLPLAA